MPKLSGRNLTLLLLALAAFAGLATSLYSLGGKGLWGDEVWETMWSRQQDFVATFLRFRSPPDHPLHFLLTQISTWFSDSEFFVRLPSALLATGTVVTIFLLGKRVFGAGAGLFAALLLAVAPYHVWYAQEARPYAALSFYSLLSLLFFWSLLERVTFLRALGFAIATCLNIYNHLFGLFPLITEGVLAGAWAIALFYTSRNMEQNAARAIRIRIRNTLTVLGISSVVGMALCFPLIPGIVDFISKKGPNWSSQVAPTRFDLTPSFFADLLSLFGAGSGWPFLVMFSLFMLGTGAALWSRQWFGAVAVAWIALPPLVLWIAQPQHVFTSRYLLFIQPVYVLMVAYGLMAFAGLIRQIGSKLLHLSGPLYGRVAVAMSVLLAVSLWALAFAPTVRGYGVEKVSNWSAACAYLWENTGPGDVVVADFYGEGTLTWCFDIKNGAPYMPDASADNFDVQDAVRQKRGVWYVNIDPNAPAIGYVRQTFREIPRGDWDNTGPTPPRGDEAQFYPESEPDITIYHYAPDQLPSSITFHERKGAGILPGGPDYIEIPAERSYSVRLSLPASAPRQLRVNALHLGGRSIEISVDGVLLGTISAAADDAPWQDTVFPLPASLGEVFTVRLNNPGKQTCAVSSVEVERSTAR